MLTEIKHKQFGNGVVYALKTKDGYPIETTDTFLPYYTKECINDKSNKLISKELGDRSERWMIGVSVMSGCPVGCKFCATGQLKKWRSLGSMEIVNQITTILDNNHVDPYYSKEFKINYTRMGEPFLNLDAVRAVVEMVNVNYPNTHHYISTVGIKGSDFRWIKDNITLQISLHALSDARRKELIPYRNLMSIKELGSIRTKSKNKTTVNLTLVKNEDFDIEVLKKYFDPKYFFIKLSPINTNVISESNCLGNGVIEATNLL